MPVKEHTFVNDPKRRLITTPTRSCSVCKTGKTYPRRITIPSHKRRYKTVWKCTNPQCRAQRG